MTVEKWQFEMSTWEPDWGCWGSMLNGTCAELCALALNVNPDKSGGLIKRADNDGKPDNDGWGATSSAWGSTSANRSESSQPPTEAERLYRDEYRRLFKILSSHLFADEEPDTTRMRSKTTKNRKFTIVEFIELVDRLDIPLPEGFPRGSGVVKTDIAQELREAYRVIAELLIYAKDDSGRKIKQGVLSKEISGRGIGISKRDLDAIFSNANKEKKQN